MKARVVQAVIGTAFLAQLVARVAVVNQEEAFLYGLVHDLGKLLVLQLSKEYVRGGGTAPAVAVPTPPLAHPPHAHVVGHRVTCAAGPRRTGGQLTVVHEPPRLRQLHPWVARQVGRDHVVPADRRRPRGTPSRPTSQL